MILYTTIFYSRSNFSNFGVHGEPSLTSRDGPCLQSQKIKIDSTNEIEKRERTNVLRGNNPETLVKNEEPIKEL